MRASGAQGLANNARSVSMNAYGLWAAWRARSGAGTTARRWGAKTRCARSSAPPKARRQQQGGALATAMLVGRMLLLDNSNDRAQMLDVGNVIMIMHG